MPVLVTLAKRSRPAPTTSPSAPAPTRAAPDRRPRPPRLLRLRRAVQFLIGLLLCIVGVWLSLRATLGVSSWDVLHSGLVRRSGFSFGTVVAGVGLLVLAVSALLGVRPKLGTLVNVAVNAVGLDALLATSWLDGLPAAPPAVRAAALVGAVVLLGCGGAVYIGAGLGSGPRDSLMIACHLRGWRIGPSRIAIEVTVLLLGWLLGGPVGVGTVVMAFALGPTTQLAFRLLRQRPEAGQRAVPRSRSRPAQ